MDQKQPRMQIAVAEDKSSVTVTFLPASGASGSLDLTPAQLLALIRALGGAHAALSAGKEALFEGQEIEAVFNTRWVVQPEMVGEASVLSFYHPSYGPLGFAVPIDQAEEMARLLNVQADMSRASKSGLPQ